MFEIRRVRSDRFALEGRLDATHESTAETFLATVETSAVFDFAELTYIGSNGLGLLFAAQKRLAVSGHSLTLTNLNPHIRELFKLAGFDTIFTIEADI